MHWSGFEGLLTHPFRAITYIGTTIISIDCMIKIFELEYSLGFEIFKNVALDGYSLRLIGYKKKTPSYQSSEKIRNELSWSQVVLNARD